MHYVTNRLECFGVVIDTVYYYGFVGFLMYGRLNKIVKRNIGKASRNVANKKRAPTSHLEVVNNL